MSWLSVTPWIAARQASPSIANSWSLPINVHAAAAAKSLQSCPTLCDPIDGGPPGSPVPGILQARTLEWTAISFSNAWKGKVKAKSLSPVRLFTTPWSAAYQAPLSMGFSRQEYSSGVPLPSPITPSKSSHAFASGKISTFLWLSSTQLYIYTPHLFIPTCWWT